MAHPHIKEFAVYWIVEFYPSTRRWATYGPRDTEAEIDELLASLARTAIESGRMSEVRVGKYVATSSAGAIMAATAQGMDV